MRGATPGHRSFASTPRISIHAPHARSDYPVSRAGRHGTDFNPRSSCEERHHGKSQSRKSRISIHAPHARSDKTPQYKCASRRNFNPRSSCEERRRVRCQSHSRRRISIHAPHARSDYGYTGRPSDVLISIHAPHARSDLLLSPQCYSSWYFNPRSSCEERLDVVTPDTMTTISIHAPHARSDSI